MNKLNKLHMLVMASLISPMAAAETYNLVVKHDIDTSMSRDFAKSIMVDELQHNGVTIINHTFTPIGYYTDITVEADSAEQAISLLKNENFLFVEERVEFKTPDVKVEEMPTSYIQFGAYSDETPNDPEYLANQYKYFQPLQAYFADGLDNYSGSNFIGLLNNLSGNGSKVRLGIPDDVFRKHSDVNWGNEGANFAYGNNDPFIQFNTPCYDDYDHGDIVASVAGAKTNSGIGIAGTASDNVEIIPVRTKNCEGNYPSGNLINAVYWLGGVSFSDRGIEDISTPVDVVNLSYHMYYGETTIDQCPAQIEDMLQFLEQKNIILVQSAGNGNSNIEDDKKPNSAVLCGRGRMISVGGVETTHDKSVLSSYGRIDTFTHGSGVSAYGIEENTPVLVSGTSLSSPLVAGAIATVISEVGRINAQDLGYLVHSTGTNFADENLWGETFCKNTYCGSGVIDAGRLLAAAREFKSGELSTIKHAIIDESEEDQSIFIKHLAPEVDVCSLREITFNNQAIELKHASYKLYKTAKGSQGTDTTEPVLTSTQPSVIHEITQDDLTSFDYSYEYCDAIDCTNKMPITLSTELPEKCS
ncbi:S8/S53 family peptidase [Shewanella sp. ULN5]|uniref:S8 family peptidase n=1 Tax=Shewanella sp. ULN5 TaxID=2994678 RepID=UPI00273D7A55|nr:S8/S53 family peptidase [Shewanella sp. ULN5]MDP5145274.1 S8/S53 family peptidase [Shewanella sp. ULN5]